MEGMKMRQTGRNVSPMSNEGRNSYVVRQLTSSLLSLLSEKAIGDIFDKYFLKNAGTRKEQYRQMFTSGGFFNIFKFWLMGGCRESPKELADMFLNFM